MKKILTIITASLVAITGFSQEIAFETGTWAEIKAKAKKENKLIFMDAYTTWCGPCKMMAKNTFTDKAVADYYNSNFINAKIDMEKGEGLDIAKEYSVTCYPNLVYIDGDGKLVHRAAGYLLPPQFIDEGKVANTPEKAFASYEAKYKQGAREPEFLLTYLDALSKTCFPTSDVATNYFASVSDANMINRANWNILYKHIADVNAKPFMYLVQNRKAFEEKYTADSVGNKIYNTYLRHGSALMREKENADEKLTEFLSEVKSSGIARAEELVANLSLTDAQRKADWVAYFKAAKTLVDNYYSKDASFLNNVSWTIFEKIDDKKKTAEAEQWAEQSTKLEARSYNMDTYANLLFKNGKVEEAIAAEKKALELAKAGNEDTKAYEDVIAEFEKARK